MLRVVYGPFHDLEAALAARLKASRPGEPIAVVTPSRRMADRLQRMLAVERGLALVGPRFHTFHSLAAVLVEEAGGPRGKVLSDPVLQDAVVDGLLDRRPEAGRLFGGAARPRALAAAVRSSLRDLIDAGVDPHQVRESFGEELLRDPHERERLEALLSLAQAYEAELETLGVAVSSGLVRQAAAHAPSSQLLGGLSELIYYGAYDFTGLQLELLEAASGRAETTLYLPYRREHPAFRFVDAFFNEKLAGKSPVPAPKDGAPPAAYQALDALFDPGRSASVPESALTLASASGARDEAWHCAKEIVRLVQEGFCRYEDIGVVARTLEPYRAALAEVFAENAIPLELGGGEPLLRRPAAKLALSLLTLRRRDFPAAAVLDILESPYFARRPGARALRHWRLAVQRLAIRAGWLQWRKLEAAAGKPLELQPERKRETGAGYEVPAEDVDALWSAVSAWREELGRPAADWKELAGRAAALVSGELALPAGAEPEEEQALRAVLDCCAELAAFDLLGAPPSWDAFLEALEDKLRRRQLEARPLRGVRAMGAMDARGEAFDVVFLIGLKEKLFPRPIQEDPVLREPGRSALRHPGGWWISTKAAGYEEERLLFYLTAASARRKLYCVYPRSDEAGKAEVPSLYLRELCRASGRDLSRATRVPRLPLEKLESAAPEALTPQEAAMRLTWLGGPAAEAVDAMGGDGAWLARGLAAVESLGRRGAAGELDGLIGRPEDFLEQLARRGLSPSALDTLAGCGFRFFAQRLLGLGEPDQASDAGELDARLRGLIYHAALEDFHKSWKMEGDHQPHLDGALERTFARFGWREAGVYPLLWRSLRESMEARLRGFAAWDADQTRLSGMSPLWLERLVEGKLPSGLKISGRVDRVDASADGKALRVIDYKTHWGKPKLAKLIADGRMSQLPLYAELAAQLTGGALESARVYAVEDPLDSAVHVYEGAQWEKDRAAFLELVTRRVEAVERGRFVISPDDSAFASLCRWCEFDVMCRKAHGPSRARAAAE